MVEVAKCTLPVSACWRLDHHEEEHFGDEVRLESPETN